MIKLRFKSEYFYCSPKLLKNVDEVNSWSAIFGSSDSAYTTLRVLSYTFKELSNMAEFDLAYRYFKLLTIPVPILMIGYSLKTRT